MIADRSNENYFVKLNSFEGPMDLLIYLIKKNDVDIYDIPIAVITEQYLAYMEIMKSMNIKLAGEFLVMAATLAQIKSKMLLPLPEDDEEAEDPRLEVTRPLMEYLRIKSAAEHLYQRDILGTDTFVRNPDLKDFSNMGRESEIIKAGLFELMDAFVRMLKNIEEPEKINITAETISIKEKILIIMEILEKKGSKTFFELFENDHSKSELIITFLAILEMAKLNLIRVLQHTHTGIIRVICR